MILQTLYQKPKGILIDLKAYYYFIRTIRPQKKTFCVNHPVVAERRPKTTTRKTTCVRPPNCTPVTRCESVNAATRQTVEKRATNSSGNPPPKKGPISPCKSRIPRPTR